MIWLVARREMVARLRDKGFLLSTAFILLAIIAATLIPAVVSGGPSTYEVGVVGSTAQLEPAVQAQADAVDATVTLRSYDDATAARRAVVDEAVEAAVDGQQIVVTSSIDPTLEQILNGANAAVAGQQKLTAAGIDPSQVAAAFDVPALAVVPLKEDAERSGQRQVIAILAVAVLYGLLILIGQYVAVGVVEEKSSRVVELLLSTIKPWQLLSGKVIGLGLLGLGQLLLICAVGLGAAIGLDVLAVPGDAIGTIAQTIGWFILGFAFYAGIFAAGASLVSRQEDLQSVLMPMIAVLVGAFVIGIQAAQSPDGTLARITSLVPGLSPMVMPVRAAAGDVPWWEIAVAAVLMLLAIVAVIRLGGRIYAGALLRTGGRVKIREAYSR